MVCLYGKIPHSQPITVRKHTHTHTHTHTDGQIPYTIKGKELFPGASLVAQWLRICLPMQGTRV